MLIEMMRKDFSVCKICLCRRRKVKYFCASICSPDFKFKDHLRDESSYEEQPKRQILKRESASFEEVIYLLVAVFQNNVFSRQLSSNERICFFYFQGRNHLSVDKKSKSFEEREEDYKKARDRIFSQQEVL